MLTKEILKEYLEDKFDVTFDQIVKDLKVKIGDYQKIDWWLTELVEEGWIVKSPTHDGCDYDPGEKLDYGDIRG